MKAEERKHLKENEFQQWVGRGWRAVTSGSTINTLIWCGVLLVLVALIGWRYYSTSSRNNRSLLWYELDNANTVDALNAIIKDHKGTEPARIAKFHLARFQTQDALNRLAGPNYDERRKAADDLVAARDMYRELSEESSREPTLTQEAMMNVAKTEETLAGVPKADSPSEMRGSLDQAIALYRQLADKYPESFLGKRAAERADEITNHPTQFQGFYQALSKEQGKPPAPPPLPELPKSGGPELPKPPGPAQPDAQSPPKK